MQGRCTGQVHRVGAQGRRPGKAHRACELARRTRLGYERSYANASATHRNRRCTGDDVRRAARPWCAHVTRWMGGWHLRMWQAGECGDCGKVRLALDVANRKSSENENLAFSLK